MSQHLTVFNLLAPGKYVILQDILLIDILSIYIKIASM